LIFWLLVLAGLASAQDTLVAPVMLGRPTDRSVTVHAVAGFPVEACVRYGIASGHLDSSTAIQSFAADAAIVLEVPGLAPDTRYWYRLLYRRSGTDSFQLDSEHTFHTQRAPGSSFAFDLTADCHLQDKKGIPEVMALTMRNAAGADPAKLPDFFFDLGDSFGDDHNPLTITKAELWQDHLRIRPYFAMLGNSSPFFVVLGNHEGESGYWLAQNPPDNMAVNGTLSRKFYYPNPEPNSFYTGNATLEGNGIGLPQNYYAFTWGDALFVVLDAYRGYTANAKPRNWDWTLGKEQYDWLKRTLESSTAVHKFVLAHHVSGETRGGILVRKTGEWGGYEANDTTMSTFESNRPGWGLPIHDLMVRNGVEIFFQGHDHLYAREEVDGLVYQTVPMPSDSTYRIGVHDNGDAFTGDVRDGSGHLRVTVDPGQVTVDYVSTVLPRHEDALRRNDSLVVRYTLAGKVATGIRSGASGLTPVRTREGIAFTTSSEGEVELAFFDVRGTVFRRIRHHAVAGRNMVPWPELGTGVRLVRIQGSGMRWAGSLPAGPGL